MPPERRKPTPQGLDTCHASSKASRDLPDRLRCRLREVDWLDVILGAFLGQILDALGGSGLTPDLLTAILKFLSQ
jgi:hypothetical protein